MVAVRGRNGAITIPVEATRAGVVVRTADVGIIIGTVAEALPALGGEDGIGVAPRGGTLEAVGVGQGGQQVALGVEGGRNG